MLTRDAGTVRALTDEVRRLKVLISAYAFGPSDESEASAGWRFALAAAAGHDVWVITRRRFRDAIEAALAADAELAARVHVHYVELSDWALRFKRRPMDVYWYYILWQREVARVARRLHGDVGFDVVHHVTFAVDWLPCGVRRLPVPLIWGPVGGATYMPFRLSRWVGPRSALVEVFRSMLTRILRRAWGDPTARRAAIVVAQNPDVARRFRYAHRVVTETNSAVKDVPAPARPANPDPGRRKRAVFVGRIVGWKGPRLAVAALAEPDVADWTLEFYGTGRDEPAVRALVDRLGLNNRVIFHGYQPRAAVLTAFAEADAMLFPSMHDSAPWVTGEASATGCPVVCLDLGGSPLLAGPNAIPVPVRRTVVKDLAAALATAGQHRGEPYLRWTEERLPALLADWYADAASCQVGGSPTGQSETDHSRPK
jgi:glycosyltransferase involved in cell wall biosynthesis